MSTGDARINKKFLIAALMLLLALPNYSIYSPPLLVSAGGAISNMYSVMIARYKYFPEVKTKGMAAAPRLVLFTSEHVSPSLYY